MYNKSHDIVALDTKRQALLLLKQGFDQKTIADKLKVSQTSVKSYLAEEFSMMTVEVQELQEQLSVLSIARSELLLSKLFPLLDRFVKVKEDGTPDMDGSDIKGLNETIATITKIMKLQKELNGTSSDKSSQTNIGVQNITLSQSSDFYQTALKEMQADLGLPGTVDWNSGEELEYIEVLGSHDDDRLDRLEKAAQRALGKTESDNDDDDA